jgi:hypothetical protein
MAAERARLLLCGWLLAACSTDTFLLGGLRGGEDAAVTWDAQAAESDGGMADAGPRAVFSAPTPTAILSEADSKDDDPSLSRDLTLLYFNSRRSGGAGREDIWFAQRADAREPWLSPRPEVALNTEARETGIALSADGLAIWFSSDRDGGRGGLDVYLAERPERTARFSAPQRVQALCSAGDDLVSAIDEAQQTLYLARRSGEDDDYDLYVAWRPDRATPFAEPTALTSLNTDAEESDAFALEAGARLLFTRAGDLYVAERSSAAEPRYTAPEPLIELNSKGDDRDAWASEDFRYLVFSSDRSGSYLLYEAAR